MAIVMNMGSYVVEEKEGYDDEVMCAGWNPQLELATRQHVATLMDRHAALPASLAEADAETFLQKMYACQR
ncbi:MAG: hypothetical protein EPO42_02850 [Gallionellaceae bacterium]|nr:MAG: hypothetical protein EPO42_02850 [Gallionellaceae bacterium]